MTAYALLLRITIPILAVAEVDSPLRARDRSLARVTSFAARSLTSRTKARVGNAGKASRQVAREPQ
jgi:hypothetical protein